MNSTTQQTSKTSAPSRITVKAKSRVAERWIAWVTSIIVAIAGLLPLESMAADGCLVLLCLAAPSWRNVPQCVDPVSQVLKDLARGRPFPSCPMGGNGNSASSQWASAPALCPVQYTHAIEFQGVMVDVCDYLGVVEVTVDGSLWARVWWNPSGDSVTEFMPAARARVGRWDTRFDDDYARWLASWPPVVPPGNGP